MSTTATKGTKTMQTSDSFHIGTIDYTADGTVRRTWEAHHRDASTGKITLLATAILSPSFSPDELAEVTIYDTDGDRIDGFQMLTDDDAAKRLVRQGFLPT